MEQVPREELEQFFGNVKILLSDSSSPEDVQPQIVSNIQESLTRKVEDKQGTTRTNVVYLNTDCNLRCDYCYEKDSREGLSDQANCTKEQIDLFLEEIQNREKGRNSCIVIMGGEPLLRFDLLEHLVRKAMSMDKPEGWGIPVTTNGMMLLSDKLIDRYRVLLNDVAKCTTVCHDIEVSFDVSGQYRRRLPDGSDSRVFVEKAIRKIDEADFPYRFSYTVHKGNHDNIVEDLVYLLETYPKARRIAISWAYQELDDEFGSGYAKQLKSKIRPYGNHLFKLYSKPICDCCCSVCRLCDKSSCVGNSYLSPTEGILYAEKNTERKFDQF